LYLKEVIKRKVKRKIQAVLSCLLLVIFLAGTTGITLFIHTCSSSHKTEVSAYPEIFRHSTACCCEENSSTATPPSKETEINNPECCRNQQLLLKASLIGFPVTYLQLIKATFFPIPLVDNTLLPVNQEHGSLAEYLPWLDHSPPLSGKSLVYFIHQIRIPSPVC
jgi:hypothetical protein